MDLSKITSGGLILSKEDCDRITSALLGVSALLLAIHEQGACIMECSAKEYERAGNLAEAVKTMAMVGCRKVDAISSALGEPGLGAFEADFAPIVLGGGE